MERAIAASRNQAFAGLHGSETPVQQTPCVAPPSAGDDAAAASRPGVPMASLFPRANQYELERLEQVLEMLPQALHADRAALVYAAAAATAGNLGLACHAIKRTLLGLDLHAAVRKGVPVQQRVDRAAWRLAGLLADSDSGFALLQAVHHRHADMGRAARVILQTGGMAQNDEAGSNRLPCASLTTRARQAACRMLEPGAQLSSAEKAVIFAWEQGFRSDAPGTPLAAVQQRLAKFAYKSLPRVAKSRLRSFLPRLFGQKKSPLSALRHGIQDALQPGVKSFVRPGPVLHKGAGPNDRKTDAVQASLRSLIATLGSSTRLRLGDGGARGFSSKGLSINLSTVLHLIGIPIGPRVNLGYRGSRRAILEIGRSAHGGEILIGTERAARRSCGLGVMLGYDVRAAAAQVRCGVTIDGEASDERQHASGVALRYAQRNRAGGKPDAERVRRGMQACMDFLFAEQKFATAADPAALFERFAAHFFDDPDVSLGWQAGSTRRRRRAGTFCAAAMAKIGLAPLRIGPFAGVTVESSSVAQRDDGSAGGRLHSNASRNGRESEVSLLFGLVGKISTEGRAQPPQTPGVGMFNASLPSWTIPLKVGGNACRARLIRENGRLQPARCMLDVEFVRVDDYENALGAERHAWLARLAANYPGDPQALALAGRKLDAHLAKARHRAGRNQVFIQRCNLRAEVADSVDRHCNTIDAIRACTHLSHAEQARLCAASEAACEQLLADPNAWVPLELKVIEKHALARRHGLFFGLQVGTETAASGKYQVSGVKLDRA